MTDIVDRLRALALAAADGRHNEFSMSIPSRPELDADLVLQTAAYEIKRMRAALNRISALNPETDSDEGYNEWGQADCFEQAKTIAIAALAATTSVMTPTKEQIEYYIQCADLEMGPMCADEWVAAVRAFLRAWPTESSCAHGHDWEEVTTFGMGKHERCRRPGCGVVRGMAQR